MWVEKNRIWKKEKIEKKKSNLGPKKGAKENKK